MPHRVSPSILGAGFALLLLPTVLTAQTAGSTPGGSRPGGCRGINTESSSITGVGPGGQPVDFPTYPTVAEVHKDSPAELAGMRRGDRIVAQDGRDVIGSPRTQPSFAGDTIRLTVLREGAEVPLTLVLGRWEPPAGETRVCVRVEPASSRD